MLGRWWTDARAVRPTHAIVTPPGTPALATHLPTNSKHRPICGVFARGPSKGEGWRSGRKVIQFVFHTGRAAMAEKLQFVRKSIVPLEKLSLEERFGWRKRSERRITALVSSALANSVSAPLALCKFCLRRMRTAPA